MDLVIDIQCYKDFKNVVTPKEVAILSLEGDNVGHWIVAPTASVNKLTRAIKRENNWLTQKHHGLDYSDGNVKRNALNKTLIDILKRAGKIYVRGQVKWNLLNDLTTRDIINLEKDETFPSFDNLPWDERYCICHRQMPSHTLFSCALNNAYRLKKYLKSRFGQRFTESHTSDENQIGESLADLCNELNFQSPLPSYYISREVEYKNRDEQSRGTEASDNDPESLRGCFSSRSDPQGVDETDRLRFLYG